MNTPQTGKTVRAGDSVSAALLKILNRVSTRRFSGGIVKDTSVGTSIITRPQTAVSGAGFVGILQDCPDAYRVAHVHKLTGYVFHSSKVEGSTDIAVQVAPYLMTQPGMFCLCVSCDGATPEWIVSELLPWGPVAPASTPTPAPSYVEASTLGPYQLSHVDAVCQAL